MTRHWSGNFCTWSMIVVSSDLLVFHRLFSSLQCPHFGVCHTGWLHGLAAASTCIPSSCYTMCNSPSVWLPRCLMGTVFKKMFSFSAVSLLHQQGLLTIQKSWHEKHELWQPNWSRFQLLNAFHTDHTLISLILHTVCSYVYSIKFKEYNII